MTKKRPKPRRKYVVELSYPAYLYPEKDEVFKILLRRPAAGGLGFGERDLLWVYGTLDAALRAFKMLLLVKDLELSELSLSIRDE